MTRTISAIGGYAVFIVFSAYAAFCLSACSGIKSVKENETARKVEFETGWGVQIAGLRLSASGYMLDFRFKVIDPEKARYILDRKNKAMLIDEETGAKFIVPSSPKIGSLRQTAMQPRSGITYFMFFANPGKFIKSGKKVTVVIGDFRAVNLTVE
jgi:hypothetical protein